MFAGIESSPSTQTRHVLLQSILDVQGNLEKQGLKDPKGLRSLSRTITRNDRLLAIKLAAADGDEVRRLWDEDHVVGDNSSNQSPPSQSSDSEYYQLSKEILLADLLSSGDCDHRVLSSHYRNSSRGSTEEGNTTKRSNDFPIKYFNRKRPVSTTRCVGPKAA